METYEKFINNILETRGRFNCGDEYHERHHIIPRCMNGTNDEENLIDLFAREHFIAHKLLAQENPDNEKLIFAWNMMSVIPRSNERYKLTAEEYEELKRQFGKVVSKINKGRKMTEEEKKLMSKRLKGVPKSEDHKRKISISHMGIKPSEESKRKMSERQTGDKNPRAKKIIQYDLNGNYIRQWGCIKDASDALGIGRSGINRCCQKDKGYKQCGGFIWRYINDPLTEDEIIQIRENNQRVRGIYEEKNGKWFAIVRNKRIGTFETKEEAIAAKLKAQEEKK